MSNEAVYRTALATPGLSIRHTHKICDTWPVGVVEPYLKISAPYLLQLGREGFEDNLTKGVCRKAPDTPGLFSISKVMQISNFITLKIYINDVITWDGTVSAKQSID